MKTLHGIGISIACILFVFTLPAQNIDGNQFIYLGADESVLHLVWEENIANKVAWYVVEKSYDGRSFFPVDSVQPGTLYDIHVLGYPDTINYYNRILYSTEHDGPGRYLYNDVRDFTERHIKTFWFRIRMVKPNGQRFYTKNVFKEYSTTYEEVEFLRKEEHSPEQPDSEAGNHLPGEIGRRVVCPTVVQLPSDYPGYNPSGNYVIYYGECCWWRESEYILSSFTQACNGIDAWCCPRDCAPIAYDPCCVHICSQYNQCVCPPWICCDVQNGTIWLVDTIVNYSVNASVIVTQNVSCNGMADGAISVTASGGFPPYIAHWSNGVTMTTGYNTTGLAAGVYSLTVTDNKGCSAILDFTITQPSQLFSSVTPTHVTCAGYNNGAIGLYISGGTSPYSFLWSNSATTQNLSGLSAGNYFVTVTDNNGCKTYANISVLQPSPFTGTVDITNIPCFGWTTGSALLTMTGGTYPYSYAWSNGSATQNLTGLSAGTYTVTSTDAKGCTFTTSATITEAAQLSATITTTLTNCGNCGAQATVSASGGSGPPFNYSYSWSAGASIGASTYNLCAGFINVTVSDANVPGCSRTFTGAVSNTGGETVNVSPGNPSCSSSCNGYATISPFTCNSSPCTIEWVDNLGAAVAGNVQTATNLCPGTYIVKVTNSSGCITSKSFTISAPSPVSVSVSPSHQTCTGVANGGAAAAPSGGTSPYSYQWRDAGNNPIGINSSSISSLSPGNYSVIITDFNNCKDTAYFTVFSYDFSLSTTQTNLSCYGIPTGSITVIVNGGTGPFTYEWRQSGAPIGQYGQSAYNLPAGTGYQAVVTSSTGCVLTSSTVTITQPSAISATTSFDTIPCGGTCDGTSSISISGGTLPYSYQWYDAGYVAITGATSSSISNLCAGTYFVEGKDANGCSTGYKQVVISENITISTSITSFNILCNGGNEGAIDLEVTGGTPPYSYEWNGGFSFDEDLSFLYAGTYSVIVTDQNGCTVTDSATITDPAPITATAYPNVYPNGYHVSCHGYSNGSATVYVSGGTYPYSYYWYWFDSLGNQNPVLWYDSLGNSYEQRSATAVNLALGYYFIVVYDAQGCPAFTDVTLDLEPPLLTADAYAFTYPGGWHVSCNGYNDGFVYATVSGGTPPYVFEWVHAQWENTIPPTVPPHTQYFDTAYAGWNYIYVTDTISNCSTFDSIYLTEPPPLVSSHTSNVYANGFNVTCFGAADGNIDLSVSGSTPGYNYLWNSGQTTQDLTGLTADTYVVTITDTNSCRLLDTILLTSPPGIVINETHANIPCFGGAPTGSIDITPTGGSPPYTYLWNGGQTSQDRSNLPV
ncbi:MAG TPA: SprB repeat-containing protein, partial [Chitinophagales bacterium]|nr:SprB repeat-containing protein [Chitinophagales bacterium]